MELPRDGVPPAQCDDKRDKLLSTLHTELRHFLDKTRVHGHAHIRKAAELERGESHLWHRQCSMGTKIFGKVAT